MVDVGSLLTARLRQTKLDDELDRGEIPISKNKFPAKARVFDFDFLESFRGVSRCCCLLLSTYVN